MLNESNFAPDLASVALALDVTVEALNQWKEHDPEPFTPGPHGFDIRAIGAAGVRWLTSQRSTPDAILDRIGMELETVRRQTETILARAAQVKDALVRLPAVCADLERLIAQAQAAATELEGMPACDAVTEAQRQLVEASIAAVRASDLNALECVLGVATDAPASRMRALAC